MEKSTLEAYCLKHPGAVHDYKVEWEADRYQVGGKMFAMLGGDSNGKPILSVKCDPARAEQLREAYEGIIPGYYLNKSHWNSIYLDANIPTELWEKLITHSYELVFHKLPKKMQKELVK
ncbi:MmcQ/YjbR family DNA-binding protein [Brevibacillus laterosporus]|uniref:MmcQ/YjbR family DNA-binding protein n=1 Tax=Brevibacillus laterosporus TaxID=1465 RepID=UPI0018CE762B|nr:MmcQ/YjbR family DNA-binding protein [Brevibacillus laterosporus]MBG9797108.1 MmcQ [Brevibacillus laterosporus]MCR8938048.1 MmcQ/YjbR family DNA-binding protein [Brevibacillus laterosporus]MCZ0840688.1 MmcQ/YjbR family DNA-binding protein [Brevibacillus laterosporus]MCZ0847485.1 MmcQ/YjbR family DNA-binding protein [Brevibacillus laterosporus]MED1909228.1 MmcQ/YjbR family DNA-binding protein [Brevibacillus laterosporus]